MNSIQYTNSSGNVFADLGRADADQMMAKAVLAARIGATIAARGLTQRQAAEILGVDQPKVSALLTGKLSRYSLEKLMKFLLLLGADVAIHVHPMRSTRRSQRVGSPRATAGGRLTVVDAARQGLKAA